MDNEQIAQELGITVRTVKAHFNSIYKKLRIGDPRKLSRVTLAVMAYRATGGGNL